MAKSRELQRRAAMDNNPYPSPFSATASPPENGDGLPTAPTSATTETPQRDLAETQTSLQQASVALEAAYQRIRQFRRSLLDVADIASTSAERPSEATNDNRRGHPDSPLDSSAPEDTVLGSDSDDELYAPLPPRPRPLHARRLPLPRITTSRGISNNSIPLYPHAPSYIYRSQPPMGGRSPRHRESLADDGSTSLGRRVAAREAAGTSTPNPGSAHFLPRYEGNPAQLLAILEEYSPYRLPPRPENPNPTHTTAQNSPISPVFRRRRTPLNAPIPHAGASANSSLVPQPESVRRRLTGGIFPSRSTTMSNQSEHLSLLLPTPLSASSSRPLLFEEPSSYVRAADFIDNEVRTNEMRNDRPWTGYGDSVRSYVMRRRYNADGDEHVHPINLEWLDDHPLYIGQAATRRPVQLDQSETTAQRRRGWARLDADGNEIPSEEEEQLERARSEYRRHAQSQRSPQEYSSVYTLQAPTTSTSLTPSEGEDDPMTGPRPRVRLAARGSMDHYGSVMDSVAKVDANAITVEKRSPSPVVPFYPNPLPTPIEEMVWAPPKRKLRVNSVSKYASFAGR
ncbi:hypothetical protein C0991_006849 [Blastosporella zonata]|nr:hypothetical protein C0991_006849 [Blastosporella zonata]